MSDFSAIRAIIIVVIITLGAFSLLSISSAIRVPTESKQHHVRSLTFSLIALVLLVLVLLFLPGGTSMFK